MVLNSGPLVLPIGHGSVVVGLSICLVACSCPDLKKDAFGVVVVKEIVPVDTPMAQNVVLAVGTSDHIEMVEKMVVEDNSAILVLSKPFVS